MDIETPSLQVVHTNQAVASSARSQTSAKKQHAPVSVPSSKGHRPWKESKRRTAAAQRRTASLKLTLEQKKRKREQREALHKIVLAGKEADKAAKEAERQRKLEKKKRKEENERRGTQAVVITNPKKLAKMSRKQYLNYVHRNKVLN